MSDDAELRSHLVAAIGMGGPALRGFVEDRGRHSRLKPDVPFEIETLAT